LEVGESGNENAGFGTFSTEPLFLIILAYRLINDGWNNGWRTATNTEKELRDFYKNDFITTINGSALMGDYEDFDFL
jgi:hypothetical protein